MIEKEVDQVINMKVAHFYVLSENVQQDLGAKFGILLPLMLKVGIRLT